jgi:hypothetical protein
MTSQVLHDENPRARKTHRCDDCGRGIFPGETYRRVDVVTDDYRRAWKSCQHCDVVLTHIWKIERTLGYDEGIDIGEYITEYGTDEIRAAYRERWEGRTVDDVRALASRLAEEGR